MHRPDKRIGWLTIVGLGAVVVAFMALSLCVTATGTARFATNVGYDATVGYAVGAIFDLAKGMLPIGVLALVARRALGTAVLLGAAWICLAVYSCLATHATVSTAISSIERTGTWKMEVRGNDKAELASVEQQLAILSRPAPPRPAKTVREALAGERVSSGVWKDSQECGTIQESVHFAKACAQVVQLRRELAAAEDYERLSARAGELRKGLAAAPIVATSDPLPAAFSATLGRVLPVGGTEGVAMLLTLVVEIISCFGLAGLGALGNSGDRRRPSERSAEGSPDAGSESASKLAAMRPATEQTHPQPSLDAVLAGRATAPGRQRRDGNPPSNVVPMRPLSSPREQAKGGSPVPQGGPTRKASVTGSHVAAFVRDRFRNAPGAPLAAKDLRVRLRSLVHEAGPPATYGSQFAAELKALGYGKWKSCGLMRYRGLQLVA